MDKDIFTGEDLLGKTGVTADSLDGWLKAKLVRPAGYADDQTPLFTAESVDRVAQIRKLEELGYGIEEIQKIIRKIGLPASRTGRKESRKKTPYLTVGNLAERSEVSPRTIKHWEDKGIIVPDMRTEGGFRLYSESYVFLCKLIRDLQLFGYTLEEIKEVSDAVREFLSIEAAPEKYPPAEIEAKLAAMLLRIGHFHEKMKLIREGVGRWEDLLKKKRKEIEASMNRNRKRSGPKNPKKKGKADA
jgi:DNA-binding transcriptional MerR regulator